MRNPREVVPFAVAVISNSDARGRRLKDLLQASGVDVYLFSDTAASGLIPRINDTPAVAIIADLDGTPGSEQDLIDALVRQDTLPVLFNDGTGLEGPEGATDRELGDRLKDKVYALISGGDGAHEAAAAQDAHPVGDAPAVATIAYRGDPGEAARNVWVLGASLGGPDAVKLFISQVPADLPVAFILAQHIGVEYMPLLMTQIRRVAAIKVIPAQAGHVLQHGQLIIAPVDRHLAFDETGRIRLDCGGEDGAPPSIDGAMAAVAARFGSNAGAIVLSGIGNDGVLGARSILEQGGTVWAQAADSCVMSSMPDHVRNACPVEFNASPEALAARLVREVGERASFPRAADL